MAACVRIRVNEGRQLWRKNKEEEEEKRGKKKEENKNLGIKYKIYNSVEDYEKRLFKK